MSEPVQRKCAIVVDQSLPTGLAINAASVLAVTLGAKVEGLVGRDVLDSDGALHHGVIYTPLPILTHDASGISEIFSNLSSDEDTFCASFSSLAQSCKTYDEYIERMNQASTSDIELAGIALYGPKKRVNKFVGSLPLLK